MAHECKTCRHTEHSPECNFDFFLTMHGLHGEPAESLAKMRAAFLYGVSDVSPEEFTAHWDGVPAAYSVD